MTALPIGTNAHDLTLPTTIDQKVSLSESNGRNVILSFYHVDWGPIYDDRLELYNELHEQFENFHASLLAISVNGIWCHIAFENDRGFHFTLLSDFKPYGEIAKQYDVYRRQYGTSERALFVVDGEGVIYNNHVSPVGVNPWPGGILKTLQTITQKNGQAA